MRDAQVMCKLLYVLEKFCLVVSHIMLCYYLQLLFVMWGAFLMGLCRRGCENDKTPFLYHNCYGKVLFFIYSSLVIKFVLVLSLSLSLMSLLVCT